MKTNIFIKPKPTLRKGVMLLAMAASLASQAAAPPALNARLIARPLTPGDLSRSGLPSTMEYSGGLNTVGIGTPVYLEVDVNLVLSHLPDHQRQLCPHGQADWISGVHYQRSAGHQFRPLPNQQPAGHESGHL